MAAMNIFVCVQRDIVQTVRWALQEFEGKISANYFEKLTELSRTLAMKHKSCAIILDSIVGDTSTVDFAKQIKNEYNAKILYIVSANTKKEDIVELIKSGIVVGVLVRPFTVQQVTDYIYKFCGIKKPEVPWYLK